ncbi:MAG: hypothetical protein QM788_13410 [Roseateles sp.]|uniref:hypothetical protein n=1 Tax=Roseateles sp. TaxID=1971397 RepID=UPI0039EA768A
MTATQAGRNAAPAPVQTPARPAPNTKNTSSAPPHYLKRVARFIVLRAAVRGRLGWPAALALLARLEAQP